MMAEMYQPVAAILKEAKGGECRGDRLLKRAAPIGAATVTERLPRIARNFAVTA